MSSPTRNGRHLGVNLREGILQGRSEEVSKWGCRSLLREPQWEQTENTFQYSAIAGRAEGEAGCKHWGGGTGSDNCAHYGV